MDSIPIWGSVMLACRTATGFGEAVRGRHAVERAGGFGRLGARERFIAGCAGVRCACGVPCRR
ncbi:MAG: hypothetical protein RIS70_335, partial [Planctomycetota bacterium]